MGRLHRVRDACGASPRKLWGTRRLLVTGVLASCVGLPAVAAANEDPPKDRSDDLVLTWITDESEPCLARDSGILLEVRNISNEVIPLGAVAFDWLRFSLGQEGGRSVSIGGGAGSCNMGRGKSFFLLPAGLAIHLRVPFPGRGPASLSAGRVVLTAEVHVEPEDELYTRGFCRPIPSRPGVTAPERPVEPRFAGYRANRKSQPFRINWSLREDLPGRPVRPSEWWTWFAAIGRRGRFEQTGDCTWGPTFPGPRPPADTTTDVHGIYADAARSWQASLGRGSSIPNADDLAFEIASHPGLFHLPKEQKRWLDWVVREHPDSTGAAQARELARWLQQGSEAETYLAHSKSIFR